MSSRAETQLQYLPPPCGRPGHASLLPRAPGPSLPVISHPALLFCYFSPAVINSSLVLPWHCRFSGAAFITECKLPGYIPGYQLDYELTRIRTHFFNYLFSLCLAHSRCGRTTGISISCVWSVFQCQPLLLLLYVFHVHPYLHFTP